MRRVAIIASASGNGKTTAAANRPPLREPVIRLRSTAEVAKWLS